MSDDDQMSMDLGIEVERTEWGKWVDANRQEAQARKFMTYAGISGIPSRPWPEDSSEVKRLDPVVAELFPDMDATRKPENIDMADAFICFVGKCFIKFAGARWIDWEWSESEYTFYEHVNPAVQCDTHDEDEILMWSLMNDMIHYRPEDHRGMFSFIAAVIREYSTYHDEKRSEEAESFD